MVSPSSLKRFFWMASCEPAQSMASITPTLRVSVSSGPAALADVSDEVSLPESLPPKRPQPAVRRAAIKTAKSPPARTDPRLARPTLPGRFIVLPSPAFFVRRSALGMFLSHGLPLHRVKGDQLYTRPEV